MKMGFKQYNNYEFYKLLIDYIPTLKNLDILPQFLIVNADLIINESRKNKFTINYGKFDEYVSDNEAIDIIFRGIENIGDIVIMENGNVNSYPFECSFSNLKTELNKLPLPVFDGGDVVIIWKIEKRITLFHHEGYFAHIVCHIK